MNQILQKINNHKYLNNYDIATFIDILSKGNTKTLFLENQDDVMGYEHYNSQIVIDKQVTEKITELFKKNSINNKSLNFLVDLYNIYLVNMMFHELEHVKQYENIKNKITPKNKIIKESIKFRYINPKLYPLHHDLYYFEYDAVIKALIKTLNFIKIYCKNLNNESVAEFNRIMATIIYHSYGNEYMDGEKSKIYSKFDSPISYTKYLSHFHHNLEEKKILYVSINELKEDSNSEYLKLINGLDLSIRTQYLLYYVTQRKITTQNIFEEVKRIDGTKVKIK